MVSFVKPEFVRETSACKPLYIRLADGSVKTITKQTTLEIQIKNFKTSHQFFIFDGCIADCILGFDFQAQHKVFARPDIYAIVLPKGDALPFLNRRLKRALYAAAAHATPETHMSAKVKKLEHWDIKEAHIGDNLTPKQHDIVAQMLYKRKEQGQFTSPERPLGMIKNPRWMHRVRPRGPPFMMKVKALSPGFRSVQKEQITNMQKMGVLGPTQSEWGTTPTFAPKKGGELRFCMNFRKLNERDTIKDNYPLPRSPQLLEKFKGMNYFTALDAASGYWNVLIHPADRHYTAIICEEGHFEHIRMPFGLRNAPATFQRMMDELLKNCKDFAHAYIDDVIIYSKTFEEHIQRVQVVMDILSNAGFLFRLAKCHFCMPEVEYLGHIVGRGGIRMNEKKMLEIANFQRPENVKAVQRFLGMTGYYRKFIKDYATLSNPLTELTKKENAWRWTEEEQKSFDNLLKAFKENVVLEHPNYDKTFFVDTDASDVGVGAVLTQFDEQGRERPIHFASRKLTPGERKWAVREKEALAIVFGLLTFRHHILGTEFIVRTDHQSLQWIQDAKVGRIARWALLLAEYEPFTVQYRSGEVNKVADALSRMLEDSECLPDNVFCGATQVESYPTVMGKIAPTSAEIRYYQTTDAFCIKKRALIEEAIKRGNTEHNFAPFTILNSMLGTLVEGRFRPVLPKSLLVQTLRNFHDNPLFAHMGAKRTCTRMSDIFTVPGLRKVARKVLAGCIGCLQRKSSKPRHGFLKSVPATRKLQQLSMDFCGPYKTSVRGYKYVLVMIDNFTKWVELVPCINNNASTVVNAFYERILTRYGKVQQLLTDNGSHFRNYMLEALCQLFGCYKAYSTPYYPEGDGQAERFMRNLNDSLSILCNTNVEEWCYYIPGVQFAYNTSKHGVTCITPHEMMYGEKAELPFIETYGEQPTNPKHKTQKQYVRKLRNVIATVHERARQNIQANWERMAAQYNRKRTAIKIKTGSYALIKKPPGLSKTEKETGRKLAMKWTEPAHVLAAKDSGKAFEVRLQDGTIHIINATRLLPLPATVWKPHYVSFKKTLFDVERGLAKTNSAVSKPDMEQDDIRISIPKRLCFPVRRKRPNTTCKRSECQFLTQSRNPVHFLTDESNPQGPTMCPTSRPIRNDGGYRVTGTLDITRSNTSSSSHRQSSRRPNLDSVRTDHMSWDDDQLNDWQSNLQSGDGAHSLDNSSNRVVDSVDSNFEHITGQSAGGNRSQNATGNLQNASLSSQSGMSNDDPDMQHYEPANEDIPILNRRWTRKRHREWMDIQSDLSREVLRGFHERTKGHAIFSKFS